MLVVLEVNLKGFYGIDIVAIPMKPTCKLHNESPLLWNKGQNSEKFNALPIGYEMWCLIYDFGGALEQKYEDPRRIRTLTFN